MPRRVVLSVYFLIFVRGRGDSVGAPSKVAQNIKKILIGSSLDKLYMGVLRIKENLREKHNCAPVAERSAVGGWVLTD